MKAAFEASQWDIEGVDKHSPENNPFFLMACFGRYRSLAAKRTTPRKERRVPSESELYIAYTIRRWLGNEKLLYIECHDDSPVGNKMASKKEPRALKEVHYTHCTWRERAKAESRYKRTRGRANMWNVVCGPFSRFVIS